jgi:hypothetical protein
VVGQMRSIPVDVSAFGGFMVVNPPEVKTNTRSGEVKVDVASGLSVFVVGIVAIRGKDSSVVQVAVPGEPDGLTVGTAVRLVGLEAVPWEIEGRSGVTFRASAVIGAGSEPGVVPAGSPRRPATTPSVPGQRGGDAV